MNSSHRSTDIGTMILTPTTGPSGEVQKVTPEKSSEAVADLVGIQEDEEDENESAPLEGDKVPVYLNTDLI